MDDNILAFCFDEHQIKTFFKGCVGHKFECFYKMIFAYRLSRLEILNLKWSDIDFINNTITIYPIERNVSDYEAFYTHLNRTDEFARLYPLLPHIKDLLIKEQQRQLQNSLTQNDYNHKNDDYICVRDNGEMLNGRTLSRNIKYITRDNNLPECLITGIKEAANDYLLIKAASAELFRCWTRFDIHTRRQNIYKDVDLFKNKAFIKLLNDMVDQTPTRKRKQESEM